MQITDIETIAITAGHAVMAIRERGFDKSVKADGSPVTEADLAADNIINTCLDDLTPNTPRITEETWDGNNTEPVSYWCVDPVDGTKGFINGGRDFTVNIALIQNRFPVLGVIYAPAHGTIWAGGCLDHAPRSWRRQALTATPPLNLDAFTPAIDIHVRNADRQHPAVVATKAHRSPALEAWINRLSAASSIAVGSSLKFCELATGNADLYPRIGPTMEWDTAAGQAILEAAGGTMIGPDGARFAYGKPGRVNTPFAAMGHVDGIIPDHWHPPEVH